MTHILFYRQDNTLRAKVIELPDNLKHIPTYRWIEAEKQAIANGIDFKEQSDVDILRIKWLESRGYKLEYHNETGTYKLMPDILNPHKLPDELEIEFKEEMIFFDGGCYPQSYAFLKQPKETEKGFNNNGEVA